jgi:exonuclease SbcD
VFSRPEALTISTKSGKVQIVGIPWPSRQNILAKDDFRYKDFDKITEYISSGVTQIISDLAHSLDPSIPAVLTGHLTVSSGVFSGSEKKAVFGNDPLFFTSSLAIAPFNYVALGHLHRFQSLNSEGQIPVVYAGSIERVDFGEVRDTKGFAIVDIATTKDYVGSYHRMANVEFVPIPVRKMIEINVRLKLDGDQFTKQILDEIKKIELSDAIVKLFYHIPPGSCDTTDISLILKSLQAAWFVAGVFPVCKPVARNSRLGFEQNKDFSATELLAKYFEHKGIEKNHSSELLKQACCIIDSVNLESITNLSET